MQNDAKTTSDYIQGFNQGYLIAQELPELAEHLAKVKSDDPRMEGFRDGREQLILEHTREFRQLWMKENPGEKDAPEKQKDKDKDIDHER